MMRRESLVKCTTHSHTHSRTTHFRLQLFKLAISRDSSDQSRDPSLQTHLGLLFAS
uniref:Uncharacterized protein n=1 Tax=Anopheles quadriannulatus TaxID=34691 RepID=A0A182XQQ2_ANOQN